MDIPGRAETSLTKKSGLWAFKHLAGYILWDGSRSLCVLLYFIYLILLWDPETGQIQDRWIQRRCDWFCNERRRSDDSDKNFERAFTIFSKERGQTGKVRVHHYEEESHCVLMSYLRDQRREGNLIKNGVVIVLFWHTSWGRGYPTLLQWYRLVVARSQKCICTGVGILRQHIRKMFESASSLSNSSPLNHLDLATAHSQERHKVFKLYMYRSSIRALHHDWRSPSRYWL